MRPSCRISIILIMFSLYTNKRGIAYNYNKKPCTNFCIFIEMWNWKIIHFNISLLYPEISEQIPQIHLASYLTSFGCFIVYWSTILPSGYEDGIIVRSLSNTIIRYNEAYYCLLSRYTCLLSFNIKPHIINQI